MGLIIFTANRVAFSWQIWPDIWKSLLCLLKKQTSKEDAEMKEKTNIQDAYVERSQWGVWTFGNFYANDWCQWFDLFMAMEFGLISHLQEKMVTSFYWTNKWTVLCGNLAALWVVEENLLVVITNHMTLLCCLPHWNLKDTHMQIQKQLGTVPAILQQYGSKF